MEALAREILNHMATNPKLAGVVGGTTTITSTFEVVQGGVNIFAICAGALLSVSLITIHLLRWFAEKRESDLRYKLLKLELENLEKEKKERDPWPYRSE